MALIVTAAADGHGAVVAAPPEHHDSDLWFILMRECRPLHHRPASAGDCLEDFQARLLGTLRVARGPADDPAKKIWTGIVFWSDGSVC